MKTIALCIGLAIAVTAVEPASAMDKQGTAVPKAKAAQRAPLTATECTGLGGTVDVGSKKCTDAKQFTCTMTTISATGTVKTNQVCVDK